jgi:hypothetical protein
MEVCQGSSLADFFESGGQRSNPRTLTWGKVCEFVYQNYCRAVTCCFVLGSSIGSV